MDQQQKVQTEIIDGIVTHTLPEEKPTAKSIITNTLSKFENVENAGDGIWSAICPNCNERIHIVSNPGGKQKLLFNCPSGCTTDQICSSLGISTNSLILETENEPMSKPGQNTNTSLVAGLVMAPKAKNDITTFVDVISKHFPIRQNEMTQRGEIFINGKWKNITDADEAIITQYCQDVYGISHRANLRDAILVCQSNNIVNPLTAKLDGLVWDGKRRTRKFLHEVLKCEDNKVTEEISQMIFTGGVRRAFEPGCKWDNVPVLVGAQGSGKSTTVDLLGLGYSIEIKTFSGKEAIENIGGVWIGEIGELSAMRKAKDLEEIKSFITTRTDKTRKAYGHNTVLLPRRCIFIGTTNSKAFLTDQTGNRRFFPVVVRSSGKMIWMHIEEIKAYILQCWAEAVHDYHNDALPKDYDHSIDFELNQIRELYKEDDWKLGAIDSFLETKDEGQTTCCLELWVEACRLEEDRLLPKDSRAIGEHLDNHPEWERLSGTKKPRFVINGRSSQQRAWIKRKRIDSFWDRIKE